MGPPSTQFISYNTPEKRCHCKHSKCLQLYCECFASGNYCRDCDCSCCLNTEMNDVPRVQAIRLILARNPDAFRPKIMAKNQDAKLNRQNKGCRCKKSHCLKKYCECFQAGIGCSPSCRCIDCKNGDSASLAARAAARDAATGLVNISEREREAAINKQYTSNERVATPAVSSGGGILEMTLESLRYSHPESHKMDEGDERGALSSNLNVDLDLDARSRLSDDYISQVEESLKRAAKDSEKSWLSQYPLQSPDTSTSSSRTVTDDETDENPIVRRSRKDHLSTTDGCSQTPPTTQQDFLQDLYSKQENVVLAELLERLSELADPKAAS